MAEQQNVVAASRAAPDEPRIVVQDEAGERQVWTFDRRDGLWSVRELGQDGAELRTRRCGLRGAFIELDEDLHEAAIAILQEARAGYQRALEDSFASIEAGVVDASPRAVVVARDAAAAALDLYGKLATALAARAARGAGGDA